MMERIATGGCDEQRIQDGAFQSVDPLVAARAFMGMLIYHRLLTVLFQAPLTQKPEDIVRTFVTVFMKGLTRQPSQAKKKNGKTRSSKILRKKERS